MEALSLLSMMVKRGNVIVKFELMLVKSQINTKKVVVQYSFYTFCRKQKSILISICVGEFYKH